MDKIEALKFFNGTELQFKEYYKYVFTYVGQKDGEKVVAKFVGDASDIYKQTFEPTEIFDPYDDDQFSYEKIENGVYLFSEI